MSIRWVIFQELFSFSTHACLPSYLSSHLIIFISRSTCRLPIQMYADLIASRSQVAWCILLDPWRPEVSHSFLVTFIESDHSGTPLLQSAYPPRHSVFPGIIWLLHCPLGWPFILSLVRMNCTCTNFGRDTLIIAWRIAPNALTISTIRAGIVLSSFLANRTKIPRQLG